MADRHIWPGRPNQFDPTNTNYDPDNLEKNKPGGSWGIGALIGSVLMGGGAVLSVREMIRAYKHAVAVRHGHLQNVQDAPRGPIDLMQRWIRHLRVDPQGRFGWEEAIGRQSPGYRDLVTRSGRGSYLEAALHDDFPTQDNVVRQIREAKEVFLETVDKGLKKQVSFLEAEISSFDRTAPLGTTHTSPLLFDMSPVGANIGLQANLAMKMSLLEIAQAESYATYVRLLRPDLAYDALNPSELPRYVSAAMQDPDFVKIYAKQLKKQSSLHHELLAATKNLTGADRYDQYQQNLQARLNFAAAKDTVNPFFKMPYEGAMSPRRIAGGTWNGGKLGGGAISDLMIRVAEMDANYVKNARTAAHAHVSNRAAIVPILRKLHNLMKEGLLDDVDIGLFNTGGGYSSLEFVISKNGNKARYEFPLQRDGSFRLGYRGTTYNTRFLVSKSMGAGRHTVVPDVLYRSANVTRDLGKVSMGLTTGNEAWAQSTAMDSLSITGKHVYPMSHQLVTGTESDRVIRDSFIWSDIAMLDRSDGRRTLDTHLRNVQELREFSKLSKAQRGRMIHIDVETELDITKTGMKEKPIPFQISMTVTEIDPKTGKMIIVDADNFYLSNPATNWNQVADQLQYQQHMNADDARSLAWKIKQQGLSPDAATQRINAFIAAQGDIQVISGANIHNFDMPALERGLGKYNFKTTRLALTNVSRLLRLDVTQMMRVMDHGGLMFTLDEMIKRSPNRKLLDALGQQARGKLASRASTGAIQYTPRAHDSLHDSLMSSIIAKDIFHKVEQEGIGAAIANRYEELLVYRRNMVEGLMDLHRNEVQQFATSDFNVNFLMNYQSAVSRELNLGRITDLPITAGHPGVASGYSFGSAWWPGLDLFSDPRSQIHQLTHALHVTKRAMRRWRYKGPGGTKARPRTLPYLMTEDMYARFRTDPHLSPLMPMTTTLFPLNEHFRGGAIGAHKIVHDTVRIKAKDHKVRVRMADIRNNRRLRAIYEWHQDMQEQWRMQHADASINREQHLRNKTISRARAAGIGLVHNADRTETRVIDVNYETQTPTGKPIFEDSRGYIVPEYFEAVGDGEFVDIYGTRIYGSRDGLKYRQEAKGWFTHTKYETYLLSHDTYEGHNLKGLPVHFQMEYGKHPYATGDPWQIYNMHTNLILEKVYDDMARGINHDGILKDMGLELREVKLPGKHRYTERVVVPKSEAHFFKLVARMQDKNEFARLMKAVGAGYSQREIQMFGKEIEAMSRELGLDKYPEFMKNGKFGVGAVRFLGVMYDLDQQGRLDRSSLRLGLRNVGTGAIIEAGGMPTQYHTPISRLPTMDRRFTRGVRLTPHVARTFKNVFNMPYTAAMITEAAKENGVFVANYLDMLRSWVTAGPLSREFPGIMVINRDNYLEARDTGWRLTMRGANAGESEFASHVEYEQHVRERKAVRQMIDRIGGPSAEMTYFHGDPESFVDAEKLAEIEAGKARMQAGHQQVKLQAMDIVTESQIKGTIYDITRTKDPLMLQFAHLPANLRTIEHGVINELLLGGNYFRHLHQLPLHLTGGQRMYIRTAQVQRIENAMRITESLFLEEHDMPLDKKVAKLSFHLAHLHDYIMAQSKRKGLVGDAMTAVVAGTNYQLRAGEVARTPEEFLEYDIIRKDGAPTDIAIKGGMVGRREGKKFIPRLTPGFMPINTDWIKNNMDMVPLMTASEQVPAYLVMKHGTDVEAIRDEWRSIRAGRTALPIMFVGNPEHTKRNRAHSRVLMGVVVQDLHEEYVGAMHSFDLERAARDIDGDKGFLISTHDVNVRQEWYDSWERDMSSNAKMADELGYHAPVDHYSRFIHKKYTIKGVAPPRVGSTRVERDFEKTIAREIGDSIRSKAQESALIGKLIEEGGTQEQIHNLLIRQSVVKKQQLNWSKMASGVLWHEAKRWSGAHEMLMIDPKNWKDPSIRAKAETLFSFGGRLQMLSVDSKKVIKRIEGKMRKTMGQDFNLDLGKYTTDLLNALENIETQTSKDWLWENTAFGTPHAEPGSTVEPFLFSANKSEFNRQIDDLRFFAAYRQQSDFWNVLGGTMGDNNRSLVTDMLLTGRFNEGQLPGSAGVMADMIDARGYGGIGSIAEAAEYWNKKHSFWGQVQGTMARTSKKISESRVGGFGVAGKWGLVAAGAAIMFGAPHLPGGVDTKIGRRAPDEIFTELPYGVGFSGLSDPPIHIRRHRARVEYENPHRMAKMMAGKTSVLPNYNSIMYTPGEMRHLQSSRVVTDHFRGT